MNVLVTGHDGFIGSVLVPLLVSAGHEVRGLDLGLFRDCRFGPAEGQPEVGTLADVREVTRDDLVGLDAVVHLAALSNDPLGNLNSDATYAINHRASVRLARLAREVGVSRFLFASSCSLYGVAAGDGILDEDAPFNPITPYGESKVMVEREVRHLASDGFSPVCFRNATAYGASPRLRLDLVVNDLVARAVTEGKVTVLSDGTPWRPLVHVADIAEAFVAALQAPRHAIHNRAFNVGRTEENYRVSDLAEMVASEVPDSEVHYAPDGGPDPRSYRVDCSRIAEALPGFRPRWTVLDGVRELRDAFIRERITRDDVEGDRFVRLRRIRTLQDRGLLDSELRWTQAAASVVSHEHGEEVSSP